MSDESHIRRAPRMHATDASSTIMERCRHTQHVHVHMHGGCEHLDAASLQTRREWAAARSQHQSWCLRARRGHAHGTQHALSTCRGFTLVCVRCGSLVHTGWRRALPRTNSVFEPAGRWPSSVGHRHGANEPFACPHRFGDCELARARTPPTRSPKSAHTPRPPIPPLSPPPPTRAHVDRPGVGRMTGHEARAGL
jgi:hypothetical protein